jgi:guanylate cyclase
VNWQAEFARHPDDTDEARVEKLAALLVAGSSCAAGAIWTLMYLIVFGWGLVAALPLAFVVIVGAALVVSHLKKDHRYAVYAQIFSIIYIPAAIQWNVGGVWDSGLVIAWAVLGPIVALVFFSVRHSMVWLGLSLINIVITVVFDDSFASNGEGVGEGTRLAFVGLNLGVSSLVVFAFAGYFVAEAVGQRETANRLLLNVLPAKIAPMLKESDETIAEHYESASVLFADIVGSTPLFTHLDPTEAVDWLNEVFSRFDALVERHGLEKIGTIGDSYMAAAGVPEPREDHASAIAALALDMVDELQLTRERNGKRLEFRIGINSGPLVAGVIGKQKFHYDVWGDTVNTASRMESHGEPGRVQVSKATYDLLGADFVCEPRGPIDVKGKGSMETWFLVSRRG